MGVNSTNLVTGFGSRLDRRRVRCITLGSFLHNRGALSGREFALNTVQALQLFLKLTNLVFERVRGPASVAKTQSRYR